MQILDEVEVRILGVLMEKEKTTPEYYPMTPNAIMLGCNQKTSRNPVVQYTEDLITNALQTLKVKGLVATVTGSGRIPKYRHTTAFAWNISEAEHAILCLLMLRGPLTPGEIKSNSGRIYTFGEITQLYEILENMCSAESPLVRILPKQPGQKEARYLHLLSGDTYIPENQLETRSPTPDLIERIQQLEARTQKLEAELELIKSLLFTDAQDEK